MRGRVFTAAALLLALPAAVDASQPAKTQAPYDLCVFVNGVDSPVYSMLDFWTTVDALRKEVQRSPGCRDTVVFSASGDPEGKDLDSGDRDREGMVIMTKPPFSGLPAKKAEIERVFREKAPALGASSRTFIMFEGHGGEDDKGVGGYTLWREGLNPTELESLLEILPGQKVVFHDHCTAGSMLTAYIDLSAEQSDPTIVPACAVGISDRGEFAYGSDGDAFAKVLGKVHSFSKGSDRITKQTKLGIMPVRTSQVYLQRYLDDGVKDYLPNSRDLHELVKQLEGQGFPLASARAKRLIELLHKNLDVVSRPSHDTDFAKAYRLSADLAAISKSVYATPGPSGPNHAEKEAFIKAEWPELWAKVQADTAAAGDPDSPAQRDLETIWDSLTCDNPHVHAYFKARCDAADGAPDVQEWLQFGYRKVRRAYESARQLTAMHVMLERDHAALQRTEAFLQCESAIDGG